MPSPTVRPVLALRWCLPRVVVVQQYGELIPAEPGHQAVGRCVLQQTLSHAGEQRVAYGCPRLSLMVLK